MKQYKVGILGATGSVGREMMKILLLSVETMIITISSANKPSIHFGSRLRIVIGISC